MLDIRWRGENAMVSVIAQQQVTRKNARVAKNAFELAREMLAVVNAETKHSTIG